MSRRQRLDASREARLWISTILGVITSYAVVSQTRPDLIEKAKVKVSDIKDKVTKVFSKHVTTSKKETE